jgi:lipopolysaccharide export system protein LptA
VDTAIKTLPKQWRKLFSLKDEIETHLQPVGNAFEVHIRDLEIEWMLNRQNFFTLSGKKARIQLDRPMDAVFTGHVMLEAHQKKLEAGHVVWNLKDNTFQVHGLYVLTQHGQRITGHDICLNMQLEQTNRNEQTGENYYAYQAHSNSVID